MPVYVAIARWPRHDTAGASNLYALQTLTLEFGVIFVEPDFLFVIVVYTSRRCCLVLLIFAGCMCSGRGWISNISSLVRYNFVGMTSVVRAKAAMRGHFKTGHMEWPGT